MMKAERQVVVHSRSTHSDTLVPHEWHIKTCEDTGNPAGTQGYSPLYRPSNLADIGTDDEETNSMDGDSLRLTTRHIGGHIRRLLGWASMKAVPLFRIGLEICTGKRPRGRGMRTAPKTKERPGNYAGQYVAFDPSANTTIVAHGAKSNRVAAKARRAGVEVPVIVYVPEKDTASLY